jgi:hypothetical protein
MRDDEPRVDWRNPERRRPLRFSYHSCNAQTPPMTTDDELLASPSRGTTSTAGGVSAAARPAASASWKPVRRWTTRALWHFGLQRIRCLDSGSVVGAGDGRGSSAFFFQIKDVAVCEFGALAGEVRHDDIGAREGG